MLSTRNLKAGAVLDGRYRLERRIGGGGMGDVWEGTDTVLWRTVAVKVLLADLVDDRGFRERFRREARAIAVMQGPGVVEVYDYGEIEDEDAQLAYLIMEYVDGKPLSRLLGLWGKLGAADTLRVVGGVAEALQAAHAAGIVHRDIKPGNILVRGDGSVVLVDFGIARANHNLTLTTTGVVLGTVTYMSPEQAAGENLTAASDLYSLGVVAHQCLAGSPPFKADTPLGVLSAHLRNAPPPLPTDVPYEVTEIVRRSLQKDPSARWPDAASLAEACRVTREALLAGRAPGGTRTRVQPAPGPSTGAHRRPAPEPHSGQYSGRHGSQPVLPPDDPHSDPRTDPPSGQFAGLQSGYQTGPQQLPSSVPSASTGTHTGGHTLPPFPSAHTGAHAVNPPTGPTGVTPQAEPQRARPRRRLWMALAGALAAFVALGAIATTLPWSEDRASGTLPASESGADGAEVQGQDGDGGEWNGEDEDGPAEHSAEPSTTVTPEADASPTEEPTGSAGPSTSPSSSASPSPSASPSAPAKSTVPYVVSQSEAEARSRIEEAGLSTSVEYEGEGEARCGVVRQSPSAGSEVESGSTVQVTVRRAADAEACKPEGEQTAGPDDGQ
ncbi:protein kinase [Glycomyces sp. TRM65418]|uniref:serine/threonine protein kinase n=1 Tax=Glycomyces sp. TRM65418 TaxID=2867006 RepID=UPI001CE66AE9|nr:serine/threonine protein kinase [Glycomyces sp. TRM65418]MCC3765576.1 protein kinase [Glycomyces sp. TRM65418]QZD55178.1 protein kinase [Glycomyces sp. TRM65418]